MVYSIRKCNILLDLEEITVFFGFYAVESIINIADPSLHIMDKNQILNIIKKLQEMASRDTGHKN